MSVRFERLGGKKTSQGWKQQKWKYLGGQHVYLNWIKKRNEQILEDIAVESGINKIDTFKSNWLNYVSRMNVTTIPELMITYQEDIEEQKDETVRHH